MNKSLTTETLQQFRIIIGAIRSHFHSLEKACGIPGAQVWMLSAIDADPGITVSLLSQNLSIHVSTASNMLNKLEKSELIYRIRDESDRRVVCLRLTAKGERVLKRAPRPLSGLIPYALDKLPRSTLSRMNKDLDKLIMAMGVDENSASKPMSDLFH